jgi:hypothetical protein
MYDMDYMTNVMPDMASADEWATIRIRSELKRTIERDILPRKKHGVPLYNSVADFVHAASMNELEKFRKKKEGSA